MLVVLYLVFQRALAFFCMCLKASRRIHDKLFYGIIRAKMYFFSTNSSGRIINRFSKDIFDIDSILPIAMYDSVLVSKIVNRSFISAYIFILFLPFIVFSSICCYYDISVYNKLLALDTNTFYEFYFLRTTPYICEYCQMHKTS